MSCDFCKNDFIMDDLEWLARNYGEINFCPICGKNLRFERMLMQLIHANTKKPEHMIKDENGETIIFERREAEKKDPVKKMDYSIDLDKVNIDREIEILNKHHKTE